MAKLTNYPMVSVIMPVYNSEKYVAEAIESILKQSYKNFELLIFDDGSTDRSREIVESYKDKRIRSFFCKTNKGYVIYLNEGIRKAKGKYIARMDADDISLPKRLEKQVEYMEKNPDICVCGGWIKTFGMENRKVALPVDNSIIKSIFLFRNVLAHPTVMMRRSVLIENGLFYDNKYLFVEDYELWTRISKVSKIVNLNEYLLKYRIHSLSVGKTKAENQKRLVEEIHKTELAKLGLKFNQSDFEIHETIVRQKFVPSRKLIDKVEKWMITILEANKKSKIYDKRALEEVLYDQWFYVCYNSWLLGPWVNNKFEKSRLFIERKFDKVHRLLFLGKTYIARGYKEQPLVTVIMPVYNSEKYVAEAIESILNQSYTNFELLIFDDGSSDRSREIVESFRDQRIKLIINKKNIGITASLNKGLVLARGKYIARMDADDISLSKRFEKQVEYLEKHPLVGVCGTWIKNFGMENNSVRMPTEPKYLNSILLFRNAMAHPSVMIRKSVLEMENIKYNEDFKYVQDYELWSRIFRVCKIVNLNEYLLKYRIHNESVGKTKTENQRMLVEKIHKFQLDRLGIKYTEDDFLVHETIVRQKFVPRKELINQMEKWMLGIYQANLMKKIYDNKALLQVLYDQWFYVCYNSTALGSWVLDKFLSSKLFMREKFDLFHEIIFKLKTYKPVVYLSIKNLSDPIFNFVERAGSRAGFGYKLTRKIKRKFKIGMAVLAYNRPEYLEICLESLFNTNLHDYDVTFLLQDDGSDDERVKAIIEKKRDKKYKIIRYYTEKGHNSWGAVFNKAVKKLREIDDFDIIGTSDSDAFYHPEWLDRMVKICIWAKENHKDQVLGPFSCFNSSDYEFHRILGVYKSPFGNYVVKERMGALNYFYYNDDLDKLGLFEESKDDETLMTEKLKIRKVRNFCTEESLVEHIGKYSILNKWRPVPVENAVVAMNLVKDGWGKDLARKYPKMINGEAND